MLVLNLAYAAEEVCSTWSPAELRTRVNDVPSAESSGLARWGNHLLTHPDSAAQAELYEIDDEGEFFRTIPISGATNTDWEDLAVAACDEGECAFIGDIGDNDRVRDEITIWRVPLSEDTVLEATACPLTYADGEAYDAEALLYFPDGSVRVVTKSNDKTRVFRSDVLKCDGEAQELVEEATLDLDGPVTGGTVSADGTLVALRGPTIGWVWRGCILDWALEPTELLFVGEDQGEAFTVNSDGSFTSSSEGEKFELHELPCAEATPLVCDGCACESSGEAAWGSLVFAAWGLTRRRRA